MSLEVFYNYRDSKENSVKDMCRCYQYYHIMIKMNDGTIVDGIIESVDDDNITLLVGEDVMSDEDNTMKRQPPRRNRYRRYTPRRYPYNRIGGVGLMEYPLVPPIVPPIIPPVYPYPYYPY